MNNGTLHPMNPKIAKLFKEIGELGSLLKEIPDGCAEL